MPYVIMPLQRRPLVSDNISLKIVSAIVKESEKQLPHPHLDEDQHQK